MTGMTPNRAQRGATLFTALMILLLLTVLALSVAQVTGLQERMAGLYRADQQAFQSAEVQLRQLETSILDINVCIATDPYRPALPASWLDFSTSNANRIETLTKASPNDPVISPFLSSAQAGVAEDCLIGVFRVSSMQPDNLAGGTTRAIVQSIYVP